MLPGKLETCVTHAPAQNIAILQVRQEGRGVRGREGHWVRGGRHGGDGGERRERK